MLSDESRYRLLRHLDANPDSSQRELARALGVSVGKVNYCLQALIDKGLIKAGNFSRSPNKRRYAYVLTPRGLEQKARITAKFLKWKVAEYEALEREIKLIRAELDEHKS
ncbi:MAG: MarR family EPS-associated transcriptional regulator [Pseudohongiellaceae bacterium]